MDITRTNDSSIISSHDFITTGQQKTNAEVVTDTAFIDPNQVDKIAFLNRLYVTRPEDEGNNSVTIDQNRQRDSKNTYTQRVPLVNGVAVSPKTKANSTSEAYLEIIRAHYVNEILQALKKVQVHACTSGASVYIHKVLHTIRLWEEKSPHDPALEILLALYDALAFDGLWATYTAEQYKVAEQVLMRVVNEPVNPNKIEKAIAVLEQAGFDTMPYTFSLDDEDED